MLALAERLARGAGALTVRLRAGGGSGVDAKSSADRRGDRGRPRVRAVAAPSELARLRPDDAVLGEEGVDRPGGSGVRWVVDPIDGTVNFLYGLPPVRGLGGGRAWTAGWWPARCTTRPRGRRSAPRSVPGAYLDGAPSAATGVAAGLATAVIATGFGYDAGLRAGQGEVAGGLLARVGNVRRLGSAALDLCYVAAGRLDGYYEHGLKDWDRAAGLLVATEAGAVVGGLRGRPPGTLTVAASPAVAAELSTLLEELGADDLYG